MRVRELTHLAALLLLASCDAPSDAPDGAALATSVPVTAECADVPQLRQRTTDDHLRVAEVSSQQNQIVLGSRANFLSSLALVAQLRCIVMLAEENSALETALGAAREAEDASSFYEQLFRWNEANYALTQILDRLVQRLPPSAAE